ncbi:hypothetical protein Tco_0813888 [Tanacetum coccineum]
MNNLNNSLSNTNSRRSLSETQKLNKHFSKTQKLVGGCGSLRNGGDDNGQLSSFLYIGTVEPSRTVDLQPLPSLSKPQLVPAIVSPPAMSFDDDEGEEVPPPPPPPPPVMPTPQKEVIDNGVEGGDADWSKPKLKPLQWDEVRASSDRTTV